jgi:hypothetical protein
VIDAEQVQLGRHRQAGFEIVAREESHFGTGVEGEPRFRGYCG